MDKNTQNMIQLSNQEISNIISNFLEDNDQDYNFEVATQLSPDISLKESHVESNKIKNLPQKCKLFLEKLSLLESFKLKLKCKELFGPEFQEKLSYSQFTTMLKINSSKFFTDDEIYFLFSSLKESFISNGGNREFFVNINSLYSYTFEDDYKEIGIDKFTEKIQYGEKYKVMIDNFDKIEDEYVKIKNSIKHPPISSYKVDLFIYLFNY